MTLFGDANSADWAIVYYSGHGIELGGVNYIIPIDAKLETDRDIALETIDVGLILNSIEGAKRLRLVILDACRDNPFASQIRRTMATRSLGKGLARLEPEAGTLVVYAAKHGETALDGTATTAHLLNRWSNGSMRNRHLKLDGFSTWFVMMFWKQQAESSSH